MRALSRREIILAVVLTAVGALVAWMQLRPPATAAGLPGMPTGSKSDPAAPSMDIPLLALDEEADPPAMRDNFRNLFSYSKSPEEFEAEKLEAARVTKLREEAQKRAEEQAEAARKQAEAAAEYQRLHPLPPPEPPPPQITLRFLGYMGDPRDKLVVLVDGGPGGDIYVVHKGEIVAQTFIVMGIDFDSVTIGYVDPRWASQQRTLRMGG